MAHAEGCDCADIASNRDQLTCYERSVCRIETAARAPWGTGFLIHSNYVLTPFHVLDRMGVLRPDNGGYAWQGLPPVAAFGENGEVRVPARGDRSIVSFSVELDYAIFEIVPQQGLERNWVKLPEGPIESRSDGAYGPAPLWLMSYPGGRNRLAITGTEGPKDQLFDDLILYKAWTDNGSSGGLAIVERAGTPRPFAMHVGKLPPDAAALPLWRVTEDMMANGIDLGPIAKPIVNIAVFCGESDAGTPYPEILEELFANAHPGVIPRINGMSWADLQHSRMPLWTDADLRMAAGCDVGVVIVSHIDSMRPEVLRRLYMSYGFMYARLGKTRVFLLHQKSVPVDADIPGDRCVSYAGKEIEIGDKARTILELGRRPKEDTNQGLFEIHQVALKGYGDDYLDRTPDLDAKRSLLIIGLRFGTLVDRLEGILENLKLSVAGKASELTVTIAFPSIELVSENPYLFDELRAGGRGTTDILTRAKHLRQSLHPQERRRVKFVPLNDIPAFVLTAADMEYGSGQMLVTPVVPAEDQKIVPRLILRDKYSDIGLFDAYRKVVELQLARADEFGSIKSWTLDDDDATDRYLKLLSDHEAFRKKQRQRRTRQAGRPKGNSPGTSLKVSVIRGPKR